MHEFEPPKPMDLVKITLTTIKSESSWKAQDQGLCAYLQMGDRVDHTMEMYFLEVSFPAYWSSTLIQMGEIYDHDSDGKARFATLQKHRSVWIYTGVRKLKEHVTILGI